MKSISRRSFLKGSTGLVLGTSLMNMMSIGVAEDAVSAATPAPASYADAAFVTVDTGKIMGSITEGVYAFLGIPYGKAARFQQPQRNDAWEGVLNTLVYGPVCPQDRTLSAKADVNSYEYMSLSGADLCGNEEKCLNLNVWTSSIDPTAKKPVLVFMHGGGLANGSSGELAYYNGKYFAKNTDCIMVSVNMRLNYLGFLDVSAYGGEEYKNSANCGLADMVLALEWVRDNIATFGGDPEKVTILGQSGGGEKVTCLASLPAAKGLFNNVAIISGGFSTNTPEAAAANTEKLVSYLGLTKEDDVIGKLTSMSYEELYFAATAAGASFAPSVGSEYFPEPWYIAEKGTLNEVAASYNYMIGTTMAEVAPNQINFQAAGIVNLDYYKPMMTEESIEKLIVAKFGDKAEAAKAAYAKAYPTHDVVDVCWTWNRFNSWGMLAGGTLSDMAMKGGATVYTYVGAYEQAEFGGCALVHTGDMAYWYDSLDEIKYQVIGDEENAYRVAKQMSSALAAFVATGNPSTAELEWPENKLEGGKTMVFDVVSEAKPSDFDAELMALL